MLDHIIYLMWSFLFDGGKGQMRLHIFKNKKADDTEIISPCEGMLNQLEASNDEVFATKTLGEGFFVRASENQIFAPVSGIITTVFPTKHAIGIRSENGMEIMLHIGVDTVRVKKDIIECSLNVHDVVKKMQPICEIDLIAFKELGILPDVYVFVTNSSEYYIENVMKAQDVYEGDVVLKCVRRL